MYRELRTDGITKKNPKSSHIKLEYSVGASILAFILEGQRWKWAIASMPKRTTTVGNNYNTIQMEMSKQTTTNNDNNNSPTPKDRPGGGEHHPHAPSCGGDLLGWITCVMTAFVHSRVHAVRKSNSREPSENVLPGPGELPLYHLSPRLSVRTGLTTRLFPQKFHFPPPKPWTKTMQPLHGMKVLCGARRHSLHSATLTKSTKNPW